MSTFLSILMGALSLFGGGQVPDVQAQNFGASVFQTHQGGTGTSTPSGILYGDNGVTTALKTITIGSGLLFSGGTLSSTGSGSGTVGTSTNETAGGLPYWTSTSGTPALLGQVATGTLSASSPLSVTAGRSVIGGSATISLDTSGTWSGNAGTVTDGVYTTTFGTLFDNRLSASSSIAGITTLPNLSLPYSQLTGTPSIAAYPFAVAGNATSTLTQFNGGLTAYASTTIGAGSQTTGLTISGGATTTGDAYFAGNVGIGGVTSVGTPLYVKSTTDVTTFAVEATGISSNSAFELLAPLSTSIYDGKTFSIRATTEDYGRVLFYSDGKIGFGGGAGGRDTFIKRSNISTFRISSDGGTGAGHLIVGGNFTDYGDTSLQAATSTAFAITGITSSLLKTTADGSVVPAVAGVDYASPGGSSFAYPFPSNATSTSIAFNGGLTAYASTTIGNGTATGGLTISGGATTTGDAYFVGSVGIGTTSPSTKLEIKGNSTNALRILGSTPTNEVSDIYTGTSGQLVLTTANTSDSGAYIEVNAEDDEYGFLIRDSGTGSGFFANLYMNDATVDYLNINVNASNATAGLVIQQDGNVGIGTTSPYAKLSVVGQTVAEYFTATSTSLSSTFPYASTTGFSTGYASSTLYYGAGLADCNTGNMLTWTAGRFGCEDDSTGGGLSFAYPFPSNATSTLLAFNGGLTAYASSTIGAGTQATGLTISGGATTTGSLVVQGTATSTFAGPVDTGIGNHITTHGLHSDASDGIHFHANNWTDVALLGAGNTANSTFYGAVNIDGNTRIATSITGPLQAISGAITASSSLSDAYISDTLTIGSSGSVADGALSANVSLLGQTVGPTELASSDFGDFTCNGTTCSLDTTYVTSVSGTANQITSSGGATSTLSIPTDFRITSTTITGNTLLSNATSTSFAVTNLVSCDTIDTDNTGSLRCGTDSGGSSFAYPFPSDATSTLIAFDGGLSSASTTLTGNFVFANATGTNATTTSLNVSGQVDLDAYTSALLLTGAGGIVAEYGGAAACTNQFVTALSAIGGTTCASINNAMWSGADLTVANGGTGLSTFGGTNTLLYTTAADTLSSEAALTYAPTTDLLTVVNASTTALTVGSFFKVPTATSFANNLAGSIHFDTTSGNLLMGTTTGSSADHVVIASATTTLYAFSIGSSTPFFFDSGKFKELPSHPLAQVATAIWCKAVGGTSKVINLSDTGTNDTNAITCTTTGTQYALTSNNSFTAGEAIRMEMGATTGVVDDVIIRVLGYRTTN